MFPNTWCNSSYIYSIQMGNAHPWLLQNYFKIITLTFSPTVMIIAVKQVEINRGLTEAQWKNKFKNLCNIVGLEAGCGKNGY